RQAPNRCPKRRQSEFGAWPRKRRQTATPHSGAAGPLIAKTGTRGIRKHAMQIDSILLVPSSAARGRILADELTRAGWSGLAEVEPDADVLAEVRARRPEVVILELGEAKTAALNKALRVARHSGCPTLL